MENRKLMTGMAVASVVLILAAVVFLFTQATRPAETINDYSKIPPKGAGRFDTDRGAPAKGLGSAASDRGGASRGL